MDVNIFLLTRFSGTVICCFYYHCFYEQLLVLAEVASFLGVQSSPISVAFLDK